MSFGDPPGGPPELYRLPHWYAVRTRARAEKKVAQLLDGSGLESYCPLVEKERQWADRKKRVAFPLFPGYVFARFVLTDISDVLYLPGVVTIVRNGTQPVPVRQEELESVRRLEEGVTETGEEPTPADFLEPGDQVTVTDGPFKGMRGVLLERRGRARVAVKLSAIRQAVAVQMDRSVLDRAG